jgi:hypothetical protein
MGPDDVTLIWGVFTRLIGVVYLVAFVSLYGQITTWVGERGITPLGRYLSAIRRDFPGIRGFLRFPSVFYLSHSDRTLRLAIACGIAAALVVIFGGPASCWALLVCYLVFLSLDVALALAFPWECVLFEAGILALFLPATLPLPDLAATAAPAPALAWAYRILLFRVVFGFGKFKFIGATRKDLTYLQGFLINQPLPTKLAWYAHRLPLWVLKFGMMSLFWVEIPGALLTLIPGPLGLVGGAGILGLMVVIHLSGNFGYFNWIVGFLCLPLLDFATPRALSIDDFGLRGPWLVTSFVLLHTLGALLYLPWNSYLSQSWVRWPLWRTLLPRLLQAPLSVLRAIEPFRWLHSYGVFPPKTMAGIRSAAVVEISYDGETWHELEYRRAPTRPEHPPSFIAPHMMRWDQTLIYETYGTTPHGLVYSVANSGMPYTHALFSHTECLLQRVLEGTFYEGVIFRRGTFPRKEAPRLARMRVYLLRPTTHAERRESGAWWSRTLIGPHHPAREHNPDFWRLWLPEPELFDFDDIGWKRESVLGRLMDRAASATSSDELISVLIDRRTGGAGLTQADAERFWAEFLPAAGAGDWSEIAATGRALKGRFSKLQLRAFERILGRFAAALEARLDRFYTGQAEPKLALPTHYHFALFTHHLVSRGKATVDAVLAEPESAGRYLADFDLDSGLYLFALFRLPNLAWEAHKVRLLDAVLARASERFPDSDRARFERGIEEGAKKMWGAAYVTPILRQRFRGPEFCDGTPEAYPEFVELPNGQIVAK